MCIQLRREKKKRKKKSWRREASYDDGGVGRCVRHKVSNSGAGCDLEGSAETSGAWGSLDIGK